MVAALMICATPIIGVVWVKEMEEGVPAAAAETRRHAGRTGSRSSVDVLARLATVMAGRPSPAVAARLTAVCLRQLLEADLVAVYVRDAARGRLTLRGRDGRLPGASERAALRLVAHRAAESRSLQRGPEDRHVSIGISAAGQVVGAIVVRQAGAGGLDVDRESVLAAGAALAATALGPAVLNQEARARAAAFQALHRMAVASGTVRDPDRLARLAAAEAQRLLHVDSVALRWWDGEARALRLLAGSDGRRHGRPALVRSGDGVIGAAFKRQRLVIEDDYANARNVLPESVNAGTRSAMAVPLRVHDRCVGALSVNSYAPRRFLEHEGQILSLLAAQIAPAIEAGLLVQQEQRRAMTLSALHEVAIAANGVLDQSLLARLVADKACALLGAERAMLVVWDDRLETLRVVADNAPAGGDTGTVVRPGEDTLGIAFKRRQPVAVDDYARWADRPDQPSGEMRQSALAVPLLVEERALGALGIQGSRVRHFEPEEIQLLSLLAAQVAPALQAANLFSELQASQAQLSHVLSHAPVVMFALDRQGRISLAHGQASIAYGLANPTFLGRSIFEILEGDRLHEVLRQALTGRQAHALIHLEGVDFDLRCSPLFDAVGRPDGVIAVAVDVSERRRAEEARRESEAKSRFLATMSHELRTPLNSVLGYSQLLRAQTFGPLNPRQARYLGHIEVSGRHLLELIEDVLDISKIHAGRFSLKLEDVELASVFGAAAIKIQPMADEKGMRLDVEDASGLRLRADRRRLEQVLLNLLSNAVKFTPAGGRITMAAVRDGDQVEMRITDTGPGISDADRELVFQEFIQLDSGTARAQQGSGLGLALCRSLVELMEGSIGVESALGQGSVFKVRLAAAPRPRARRPAAGRRAARPSTVLD